MTEIFFSDQKFGYDKEQVDSYIAKLSEAYQMAFEEHNAAVAKYSSLLEDYQRLEEERRRSNEDGARKAEAGVDIREVSDIVAKTLVNAEMLAKKIIEDARGEAAKIAEQSSTVLERTYAIAKKTMDEVQNMLTAYRAG